MNLYVPSLSFSSILTPGNLLKFIASLDFLSSYLQSLGVNSRHHIISSLNISEYISEIYDSLFFFKKKAIILSRREKATAPHSSTLAWKIPWMEEPGRLQSMGLLRVGHD